MQQAYELLVNMNFWTLAAQICNLLILAYFIRKFLFKPVQEIMEQRKAETEAIYTDAEKAKADAQAMKKEYEQNMATARQQAAEIVQNATQTAQLRGDEIVNEAKNTAAELKTKAEADIAQQRKKAVNEIKNEIGGIAMSIAGKVVERELNAKDHEALIEEFIRDVGDAS